MTDSEALHAAQLLYGLAERMEIEQHRSTSARTRAALEYCILTIERAAEDTARRRITLEEADAIADAGEVSLRRFRAMTR